MHFVCPMPSHSSRTEPCVSFVGPQRRCPPSHLSGPAGAGLAHLGAGCSVGGLRRSVARRPGAPGSRGRLAHRSVPGPVSRGMGVHCRACDTLCHCTTCKGSYSGGATQALKTRNGSKGPALGPAHAPCPPQVWAQIPSRPSHQKWPTNSKVRHTADSCRILVKRAKAPGPGGLTAAQ